MENSDSGLFKQAFDDAKGNWGILVVAGIISFAISAVSSIIPFLPFVIAGPLTLGFSIIALNVVRSEEIRVEQLFDGFSSFGSALAAYVLMILAIMCGFMLLIIPGIILAVAFSMTFYIMADNRSISPVDALKKSMEMMKGYKLDLLLILLGFTLLGIACVLTLGIGFLFLIPFQYIVMAKFYEKIKMEEVAEIRMDGEALDSDFV